MAYSSSIRLSGPFFRGDPVERFQRNVRDLMDDIAHEGEADVRGRMKVGEGSRAPISSHVQPARVSAHVRGRTSSLSGRRWKVTAVVSVSGHGLPVRQAIAVRAAASRVERVTGGFRGRERPRAIERANLAKGLT